jgi:hypothetical protein
LEARPAADALTRRTLFLHKLITLLLCATRTTVAPRWPGRRPARPSPATRNRDDAVRPGIPNRRARGQQCGHDRRASCPGVYDIVGLYFNPPAVAVVLSVDGQSQAQALARSQPAFPMMPGMPENAPTTTSGTVRPACSRRSAPPTARSSPACTDAIAASSFTKFLTKIDNTGPCRPRHPPDLRQLRNAQDANGTGVADQTPRFHVHFTPTSSSWISQVERFFAYVAADLLTAGCGGDVNKLAAVADCTRAAA